MNTQTLDKELIKVGKEIKADIGKVKYNLSLFSFILKHNIKASYVGLEVLHFNSSYDFSYIMRFYNNDNCIIFEQLIKYHFGEVIDSLGGEFVGKLDRSDSVSQVLFIYEDVEFKENDIIVIDCKEYELHIPLVSKYDKYVLSKFTKDGENYLSLFDFSISKTYGEFKKYEDVLRASNKTIEEIEEQLELAKCEYVNNIPLGTVELMNLLNRFEGDYEEF